MAPSQPLGGLLAVVHAEGGYKYLKMSLVSSLVHGLQPGRCWLGQKLVLGLVQNPKAVLPENGIEHPRWGARGRCSAEGG